MEGRWRRGKQGQRQRSGEEGEISERWDNKRGMNNRLKERQSGEEACVLRGRIWSLKNLWTKDTELCQTGGTVLQRLSKERLYQLEQRAHTHVHTHTRAHTYPAVSICVRIVCVLMCVCSLSPCGAV